MKNDRARRVGSLGLLTIQLLFATSFARAEDGWRAGTARAAITPRQPTWMAGYGSRNKPSEGAVHDLWAKTLALKDPAGRAVVLITLDLCGIGADLSNAIRDDLKSKHGLDRAHIAIACSHTHCGPVVGDNLRSMYPLDETQSRLVDDYAKSLRATVVRITGEALNAMKPATLSWETGRADFAVNRRENREPDVPKLRESLLLKGPTDHDVPVLAARDARGGLLAVVCGYACHCTVLSFYKFCGDYAGFAQIAIEARHPGVQAMFVAGCGADQNPLPRREVEIAENYGKQLADAVDRVLAGPSQKIEGAGSFVYEEIPIPFGKLPSKSEVEEQAASKDFYIRSRGKLLLKTIETEGKLAETYPYPVEVWRLGELNWVFLGGEVVVDYSLRLKRNLGSSRTWVSGYCNDVMAYIPSLRVLKEGGYEGATSMVYYGRPTSWGEPIEEMIVEAVGRLVKKARAR